MSPIYFVRLVSTIINHKRIVWSACGKSHQISRSLYLAVSTLWCFWGMWRHHLAVVITACWRRWDERRWERVLFVIIPAIQGVFEEVIWKLRARLPQNYTTLSPITICLSVTKCVKLRNEKFSVTARTLLIERYIDSLSLPVNSRSFLRFNWLALARTPSSLSLQE